MKTASQFSTSETVNKKYSFNFVYSASPMRLWNTVLISYSMVNKEGVVQRIRMFYNFAHFSLSYITAIRDYDTVCDA